AAEGERERVAAASRATMHGICFTPGDGPHRHAVCLNCQGQDPHAMNVFAFHHPVGQRRCRLAPNSTAVGAVPGLWSFGLETPMTAGMRFGDALRLPAAGARSSRARHHV
ncbi:hypothetical protein, partial [Methylobacterium sp. WL19]|uniref:hypothetical protein n=1 Tax=Methylobacterium sp. WL19 TaxID=2603896 RepID=UPI001AED1A1E